MERLKLTDKRNGSDEEEDSDDRKVRSCHCLIKDEVSVKCCDAGTCQKDIKVDQKGS